MDVPKSITSVFPFLTTLRPRNLLTIESAWSVNAICVLFFHLSARMSISYCQYDLGFDPLVGNSYQYSFWILKKKLKIARVSPVYKAGDIGDLTNYRPISVLPCFSKILERIMYNRLFSYGSQEKILYSKQFGFQSGH